MKADALYVVVTPTGHVSDCAAFDMELTTHRYIRQWLPDGVKPVSHTLDSLWQAFVKAGYSVHRIDLPKEVDGRDVCIT